MIEFQPVSIYDKERINAYLKDKKSPSCEYCFGNIYSYGAVLGIYIAEYCGCLLVKCEIGDEISYAYPFGNGDIKAALEKIEQLALSAGRKCEIYGMNEEEAQFFKAVFGDKYPVYPNRDAFDYVYRTEDLISLSGKKYQAKRNHISYFLRNFNWQYEKIDASNIPECIAMSEKWLVSNPHEFQQELEDELKIIKRTFEKYDELSYRGGLIRVDGEVIAYTMGEALSDEVFCTHIEKAFGDIRGAYPMINNAFAKNELTSFRYINREDDVGKENLRKAKLSYHPAYLHEKYEAVIG